MKKFNFKILSVFLAIAIVVSGAVVVVASPREEVNALSPNYDGSDVYYFCDLYPTLTYENFSNTFSASIYHDVRWISDSEFYRDIEEHYFFTLNNRVVIIDIKTFIPETGILSELFSHFKENNCVTGFVTSYSESDFPDTYFLDCVDIFVENAPATRWTSTFQRLSRIWKQTGSCPIRFTCWIEAFSTCILSKTVTLEHCALHPVI